MSLYDRLVGTENKIAYEYYIAYTQEQIAGNVTRADLVADLGLTTSEGTDHDDVVAEMNPLLSPLRPPLTVETMRNSLVLAEAGYQYTTGSQLKERWGIP